MELVTIKNNQVVTSTLLVAEKFGKVHSSVLRSLDNLVKQNCLTKNMFMEQSREYRGRTFRYYLMNRDGFALLVMGFTGTKALEWKLKYIQAFNEMEKRFLPRPKSLPCPTFLALLSPPGLGLMSTRPVCRRKRKSRKINIKYCLQNR